MIKSITSTNPHMVVTHSNPSYIHPNPSYNPMNVGQMRFNTGTQTIEVFDGTSWQQVSSHATVDLNMSATEAIMWAQEKM